MRPSSIGGKGVINSMPAAEWFRPQHQYPTEK
jgi:hypothetical protein